MLEDARILNLMLGAAAGGLQAMAVNGASHHRP